MLLNGVAMPEWRGGIFANCHRQFVEGRLFWWCRRLLWCVYIVEFFSSTIFRHLPLITADLFQLLYCRHANSLEEIREKQYIMFLLLVGDTSYPLELGQYDMIGFSKKVQLHMVNAMQYFSRPWTCLKNGWDIHYLNV